LQKGDSGINLAGVKLWRRYCSQKSMSQPTHDYANYRHVPCRTCMRDGKAIDAAIQPIVGVMVGGDYLLRCGHQQETGEIVVRRRSREAR
jgi:hypothetical protein